MKKPEDFNLDDLRNDPDYIGQTSVVITPNEVELMHNSVAMAVNLTEKLVNGAKEHDDGMGVLTFTALSLGLSATEKYFARMLEVIEKCKQARKDAEPELGELQDKDRE